MNYSILKRSLFFIILLPLFLVSCNRELRQNADHYLTHRDYKSLNRVVDLISIPTDTVTIKKLLGEPIRTGLDIRYFTDSVGANGCVVGAVFSVNRNGVVFRKWIGEVCELDN